MNAKKISELPKLENLSESTNVLVENNGETMRFPAKNIGAVKTVNGESPDESGNVDLVIPEGFSGSWNDLTDKPFGEEATYVDTLTWDGNTDGLTNFQDYLYKVSDLTPSLEDLKRGGVITTDNSSIESVSFTEENLQSFGDIIQIIYDDYYLVNIALTDNAMLGFNEETMEPYVLPEKGIYFHKEKTNNAHSNFNTLSLKINDYTFETTTIKQIDEKYLPSGGGGSSEFIVNIARNIDINTMEEMVSLDKTYDEIMANLDSAVLIEEIGGGRKSIYRFASKELDPDTQELYPVFHGYTSNLWDESAENCSIWHRFIRVNADNTVNLISVLIKKFATS